jgi:glutathione S-transferase
MRGANKNHPELPFKHIPVLKVNNDLTISQSTSILRYLADSHPEIDENFYPKNMDKQAGVNEFMDFFHSSMNAALMRAIQNKAFYKVFLKRQTPNIEAIEEHLAAFKKSEDLFLSNYLGNKDLMGGNDINVCDLIASATFEQAMLCEYDYNPRTKEYLSNCKEKIQGYEEILTDLKQVPSLLQKIHEKMK